MGLRNHGNTAQKIMIFSVFGSFVFPAIDHDRALNLLFIFLFITIRGIKYGELWYYLTWPNVASYFLKHLSKK